MKNMAIREKVMIVQGKIFFGIFLIIVTAVTVYTFTAEQ